MIELFAPASAAGQHQEECVQHSEAILLRQKSIRSTDSSCDYIVWI